MPAPVLGPIVIAAATAAVGSFFQDRGAKIANTRQKREAEMRQAQSIAEEISVSMDSVFYYFNHAALRVVARRSENDTSRSETDLLTWRSYQTAMETWAKNHHRFGAQVLEYFGKPVYEEYLEEIQRDIQKANEVLETNYYQSSQQARPERVSRTKKYFGTKGNDDYDKYQAVLETLDKRMFDFSRTMLRQIQSQQIGSHCPKSYG